MKTVFITGATEGIGLAFARLFAAPDCHLILVARNEQKLQEIATELTARGSQVTYYAKDLSTPGNAQGIYEDIKQKGFQVDDLINNAGFGIDAPFISHEWERERQMLQLNMLTVAYFTQNFARDMVAAGSGRILNVASIAAFQPGPYMAGYCATKSFVLSLSQAVHYELRKSGVTVTALCPGVTDTKFHDVAQSHGTGMTRFMSHATPEQVAAFGYRAMMKGKPVAIYGAANRFTVFALRFLSRKIWVATAARLLRK